MTFLLEPTVYTNSHFGDGNEAIIYSNFQCKGYEENVNDCIKDDYDSFTCSRSNVVGIICRDSKYIHVKLCINSFKL